MVPASQTRGAANQIEWTFDDETAVSVAISQAIANMEGIDVADLIKERDFILYEHVDADALNSLAGDSTNRAVHIQLSICEYSVEICPGNQITITKQM